MSEEAHCSFHVSNEYDCGACRAALEGSLYAASLPSWQPIATEPPDRVTVLVAINPNIHVTDFVSNVAYTIDSYITIGEYEAEQRAFRMQDSTRWLSGVTHWMPLPEPPK